MGEGPGRGQGGILDPERVRLPPALPAVCDVSPFPGVRGDRTLDASVLGDLIRMTVGGVTRDGRVGAFINLLTDSIIAGSLPRCRIGILQLRRCSSRRPSRGSRCIGCSPRGPRPPYRSKTSGDPASQLAVGGFSRTDRAGGHGALAEAIGPYRRDRRLSSERGMQPSRAMASIARTPAAAASDEGEEHSMARRLGPALASRSYHICWVHRWGSCPGGSGHRRSPWATVPTGAPSSTLR